MHIRKHDKPTHSTKDKVLEMSRIIKAPQPISMIDKAQVSVFLAGTIDNGSSADWQQIATDYILSNTDYNIMNPRRDDWDSNWKQSITDPRFKEQVEWELDCMRMCDVILMHFEEKSLSPITLLELGLHANSGKVVVSCPKTFWRCGNVEVVCNRFSIPLYDDLTSALAHIC